jgi:hypothetical protein
MSYIFNPSSSGGTFSPGSIDVVLNGKSDETIGSVTGLSATPAHVIATALYEESVTVQSGLIYAFNVTALNSSGFSYRLHVTGDEYWPGTSSVTIKVNYVWSST